MSIKLNISNLQEEGVDFGINRLGSSLAAQFGPIRHSSSLFVHLKNGDGQNFP